MQKRFITYMDFYVVVQCGRLPEFLFAHLQSDAEKCFSRVVHYNGLMLTQVSVLLNITHRALERFFAGMDFHVIRQG